MELENKKPESLYKYRAIDRSKKLEDDYSIDALINNKMVFSSRANFNDPFDSKVELVLPTAQQFKKFTATLPKQVALRYKDYVSRGSYTEYGKYKLQETKRSLNEMLDSYAFSCLSPRPDSNLMWCHYADSHYGFCIEFDACKFEAEKVVYSDNIASINLIEFLKFEEITGDKLAMKIRSALFCKLEEWAYEEEYRFFATKTLARIELGEKFKLVEYADDFIKSIIFGYRMDENAKNYIMERMPDHVKFKQAYPGKSAIKIRNY